MYGFDSFLYDKKLCEFIVNNRLKQVALCLDERF